MPQDKTKLTGGKVASGKGYTLKGSMASGKSSTLYGSLGKDGSSTYSYTSLTGEATRKGGQTTTEKMGRDKSGFPAQETTSKGGKPSGKQGMHHHPLYGKLGTK